MTCGKIRILIQDYVDGSASASQREAVDAHVADCPSCGRELAESRQLLQWMSGTPQREVSRDFDRKLMAALQERAPAPRKTAWWEELRLRFEWRLRIPAMVAAGSLATALIAVVVGPQSTPQRSGEETRVLLSSAIERHQELQRANSDVDWEAVDQSIALSTGSVLTE